MIISHEHKFIFLHCRKVAGSSITTLLNRYLGPDDIQIGSWTESIRGGGRYNRKALRTLVFHRKARNYFLWRIGKRMASLQPPKLHSAANMALKRPYYGSLSRNPPHATASMVRAFDPESWASYKKFCFVRNPFHYAASDYYWRKAAERGISFTEFLERKLDSNRPDPERIVARPATNWPIYTIDDAIAVDEVGRYETLEEDLKRIFDTIGLGGDKVDLPSAKRGSRRGKYRKLYDDRTRALVERLHDPELREFGYQFEDDLDW